MEALMQYVEPDEAEELTVNTHLTGSESHSPTTSGRVSEQKSASHGSESDDEEEEYSLRVTLPVKSSAPPLNSSVDIPLKLAERRPLDPTQHMVSYNPTFDQMWAPLAGPAHPFFKDGLSMAAKNHKTGTVEDAALDAFMFDEQYHTFQAYGYGVDPASLAGNVIVGDIGDGSKGTHTVFNISQSGAKALKKKRKAVDSEKETQPQDEQEAGEEGSAPAAEGTVNPAAEGDVNPEAEDEENPASEGWLLRNRKSPWAGKKAPATVELTDEQKRYAAEYAEKKSKTGKEEVVELVPKSTFHGKEEKDYQGRSWLAAPKDLKPDIEHCYIPKKWVHSWSGHTKGVSAIRFFPKTGHLILSGSMDTKIKIWNVPSQAGSAGQSGKCMRTYMGHSKAVRDITFSNDGTRFVSASYDKQINVWDTETGKVLSTLSTGKTPYVVRLHPDDDKQNILLAGMSDKKIVQWDLNTGQMTQEYDQHLGAVNTITFLDDNRRFVTSSDDKSLRVWEFGIPVVIKYISEPHMHSMPAVSVHPNKNWVACQSLDNQILIYGARDRFRLNKKKRFAGHIIAGYACQVNFSPDGRFIFSGDGEGRCWFWDWKTCKVFRTLKCHNGVCIGAEWHPMEQSKLATCGWDGLIKYWD